MSIMFLQAMSIHRNLQFVINRINRINDFKTTLKKFVTDTSSGSTFSKVQSSCSSNFGNLGKP